MPNDPKSDAPDPQRRRFLALCTSAAGICAGGLLAAPVIAQLAAPVGKRTVRGADAPLDRGPATDFKTGEPRKVVVRGPSSDAWMKSEEELGPVFVIRKEDDSFAAFSAICPHLGCAVDYVADSARYFCPCHDTYFASDGAVQNGPSQRGLDPLEVSVVDGRVMLRFRRFLTGRADRVEV